MRNFIKNFLVSTSISLAIFCIAIALFWGAQWLQIHTIFQFYIVNFTLFLAYFFIRKIEFRSVFTELLVECLIMHVIVLGLALPFHWYSQLKPWQLVLITIIIFIILKIVEGTSTKQSSDYLNTKLKKRQRPMSSGENV